MTEHQFAAAMIAIAVFQLVPSLKNETMWPNFFRSVIAAVCAYKAAITILG